MRILLTEVNNVSYDVNYGKEESGPSNQFVKLDAFIERKQKVKTRRSYPSQQMTEHQDYDKGRGKVQTLATASCY